MEGLPQPIRTPRCSPDRCVDGREGVESAEPSAKTRGAQRPRGRTEGLIGDVTNTPGWCPAHFTPFSSGRVCRLKMIVLYSWAGGV